MQINPVYCDKGLFRILIVIFLLRQNQFKALIPILGSLHIEKYFEHCIGKNIEETEIDDCLSQAKVVRVKVMKSVLEGTNYERSLKAILILAHAIEILKWEALMGKTEIIKYAEFLSKDRQVRKIYHKVEKAR